MSKNLFCKFFAMLLFLLTATSIMAQSDFTVTGTVVDANNDPLIGVSILEKGTKKGAISDIDGHFTLTTHRGATLVFSYVGFTSQEVKATSQTVKIALKEDQKALDEVVVVGYGVQKKSDVTGAISSVKDEDVANRTITSAEEALQGKTSGVQVVTTSGMPGSVPAIRVRGYSSNSDMSPLYVVDGIIMSDISSIDVADIESMEVLKDAASAAIYGAQAGNGVVLITTKSGKSTKSWGKISYDFQFASNSLAHKPQMMNANEYAEYMVEAGNFSQETVNAYWNGTTDTDWFDAVFGSSKMYKHNVSFSNGNDRGSVYVSAGYLSNDGMLRGSSDTFNRLNGSLKADYKIKPWLKVMANANVSRSKRHGIQIEAINDAFLMDPLTPVTYSADNLPSNMQTIMNSGWNILQDEAGNYYSVSNFYTFSNPLAYNASNISTYRNSRVNGNFGLEFSPIKGLTFTSKLGFFLASQGSNSYTPPYYTSAQRYAQYSSYSQTNNETANYQWDNYLNYMLDINKVHSITAMVGHSFTRNTNSYTTGGLSPDGENVLQKDDYFLFGWLNFANSSAQRTNSGLRTVNTSESYFGRVTYGYANKYLFQFSLRADAFDLSKLPLTNRWGYFPATSLAWVASQEGFWKKNMPKWWNYLKIRGSWGKNGSIGALSGYLYATSMTSGSQYAYGNDANYQYVQGVTPNSMGNDKLSWETSTQLDFGLDARFFNSRLQLTLDWYSKTTNDLLVTGLKPSLIAGGTFSPMNAGSVSNKGLEVELSWRDHIGQFKYGIRTNLSTLKNKVTYLSKGIDYISGYKRLNDPLTIFEEGAEVWHFYGYKYTGVNPENGEPLFEDIDGDGEITTNDRTNIGSAIPSVTYGITLDAAYKGFDLIVFGSGVAGSDIYQSLFSSDRTTGNRIKSVWYDDRWTASNTIAAHPAANADLSKYAISSAMVFDGSYFKIKQIQLGYTLPKQLTRKFLVENLRFYVSLDDFFTFTKYKGFDPESSSTSTGSGQGVDTCTFPVSKKVVLGFNVTF